MSWIYQGAELTEPPPGAVGFVYRITHVPTQKKYIGKKLFYKKVTKPPLKGQARRRRTVCESDWKEYTGSCTQLNEEIAKQGISQFQKEIMVVCFSRGELSYMEAKLQFDLGVLLSDDYYNGIIQCRINRAHIKDLRKNHRPQ